MYENLSVLTVVSLFAAPFIFWLSCFLSVLKNNFQGSGKVVWFLVVMFMPFGSLVYWFIGRGQRIKKNGEFVAVAA